MKTLSVLPRSAGLALVSLLVGVAAAHGSEIRVMTQRAFTAAYLELKSQFERAAREKVVNVNSRAPEAVRAAPFHS